MAADVQSLYPSVKRCLVRDGIKEALRLCSNYSTTVINLLVELTMYCLKNVVVQNDDKFYNQDEGIITGDNHSVSLANITLHHIILPISNDLNKSELFKRYIDDIIWISQTKTLTDDIEQTLSDTFNSAGLKLTFRRVSTLENNKTLEFLDVDHVIDPICSAGFYTTNFVKPTAVHRVFLNGSSYHPPSIFRSIVFSESIRLRRLNEKQSRYLEAIQKLQEKCLKSGFNKKMVKNMIKITQKWTDRFSPPDQKQQKRKEERTVWATSFPNQLKLSTKERSINNKAVITYRRPPTLGQCLTKYKSIAHNPNSPSTNGSSGPCNHCSLCGKFKSSENMVISSDTITTPTNKTFHLHTTLTCSDWGIYVATCRVCKHQYVGQTCTSFSSRWNGHRAMWKKGVVEKNDRAALRTHYSKKHSVSGDLTLPQAYSVIFVDKPCNKAMLDMFESQWIQKLRAKININRTVLPTIM